MAPFYRPTPQMTNPNPNFLNPSKIRVHMHVHALSPNSR